MRGRQWLIAGRSSLIEYALCCGAPETTREEPLPFARAYARRRRHWCETHIADVTHAQKEKNNKKPYVAW